MKYLRSLVFMMIAICVMLCLSHSTNAIVVDRRTVKLEIVNAENIDNLRVYQLLPTEYVEYVMVDWYVEHLEAKEQDYINELRNHQQIRHIQKILNELDKGNYIEAIELDKRENGGDEIFRAGFGTIEGLKNDYYIYRDRKYIQVLVPDYIMKQKNYGTENEIVIISDMGSIGITKKAYDKLDFKYLIKSVNDEDIIIDLESYQYSEAPYGIECYELSLKYDYKKNEVQVVHDSTKKISNAVIVISIITVPFIVVAVIIIALKRRK